ARAHVLVVPLWAGAGVRVKIVEALAASLPVVSTPIGAEGLGLRAGEHYLEAAEPEGVADAIASLLRDRSRAEAIARAGEPRARALFSLDAVAARVADLCESTLDSAVMPALAP